MCDLEDIYYEEYCGYIFRRFVGFYVDLMNKAKDINECSNDGIFQSTAEDAGESGKGTVNESKFTSDDAEKPAGSLSLFFFYIFNCFSNPLYTFDCFIVLATSSAIHLVIK